MDQKEQSIELYSGAELMVGLVTILNWSMEDGVGAGVVYLLYDFLPGVVFHCIASYLGGDSNCTRSVQSSDASNDQVIQLQVYYGCEYSRSILLAMAPC